MIHLEDLKVFTANAMCMVMLSIESINGSLQSVLFVATIGYTIIRSINELNKFKCNKEDNDDNAANN